jgi:hypothetical protein
MAVKIQVEFFWIMTPCSVAVGYQRFVTRCCLHLQGKCWCSSAVLHGFTAQKTSTWMSIALSLLSKYFLRRCA